MIIVAFIEHLLYTSHSLHGLTHLVLTVTPQSRQ